jgi:hypothetical protein
MHHEQTRFKQVFFPLLKGVERRFAEEIKGLDLQLVETSSATTYNLSLHCRFKDGRAVDTLTLQTAVRTATFKGKERHYLMADVSWGHPSGQIVLSFPKGTAAVELSGEALVSLLLAFPRLTQAFFSAILHGEPDCAH